MKPLPIVITSLAMRFCRDDGWTEGLLRRYLTRGSLRLRGYGPDESQWQYWILEVNSHLDIDRMFADGIVGELRGRESWGELRDLDDYAVLQRRNW